MIINTNFFGELEVDDKGIINFDKGFIGFEDFHRFVLVKEESIFLEWFQSIDDPISFAVMNPFIADPEFTFELPDEILEELNITDPGDLLVRTVVVIPEDITKVRTNLQAPIIINAKDKKAVQILLDDNYATKYEFYEKVGV